MKLDKEQTDTIIVFSIMFIFFALLILLAGCSEIPVVEDNGTIYNVNCSKSYDLFIHNYSANNIEIKGKYWYNYNCLNNSLFYVVRHEVNTTFDFREMN